MMSMREILRLTASDGCKPEEETEAMTTPADRKAIAAQCYAVADFLEKHWHGSNDEAVATLRTAAAALEAAQPPEGCVVVPREQAQFLLNALCSEVKDHPQKTIRGDDMIYHLDGQQMYLAINIVRAMLSAAPSAAQSGGKDEGEG